MHALLLIDLQNDFVEGGALAVPAGNEVVSVANEQMQNFEIVVATQDWHPANHGSFASQHDGIAVGDVFELNGLAQVAWPDHCVQQSKGAKLVAELKTDGIDQIFQKGALADVDSYSGFFDNDHRQETGLREWLEKQSVQEVSIMGLATDYCVKFTALDAVRLGLKANLILAGCRGVNLNQGDVDRAVDQLRKVGVRVI